MDQVPTGETVRFVGFNGTDTIADPHTGCGPSCGDPPHWDDGFTALGARPECGRLTMRVHDGKDTLALEMGPAFRYVQVYSGSECMRPTLPP